MIRLLLWALKLVRTQSFIPLTPSAGPSELLSLAMAYFQKSLLAAISDEGGAAPPRNRALWRGAWYQALLCGLQAQAVCFLHPGLNVATVTVPCFGMCQLSGAAGLYHDMSQALIPKYWYPLGWSCAAPPMLQIFWGSGLAWNGPCSLRCSEHGLHCGADRPPSLPALCMQVAWGAEPTVS